MARVLVIDDDPGIQRVVGLTLRLEGHDVIFASTGGEGIALLQQKVADVLVLDLGLPDINGREVYREMLVLGVRIPTLILSAYQPQVATELGAESWLDKPFEPEELAKKVSAILAAFY